MSKSIENNLQQGDLSKLTTYQAGIIQASSNRALQKFSDDALRQFGITKMQWLILGTVMDAGEAGMRITDLAKTLDTTMSYLTNTVNLLESRGMLVRKSNREDSRSRFVSIAPEFLETCLEIEQTFREALRTGIYGRISPEDFRTYMRVMYQLSQLDTEGVRAKGL